ncbi:NAD+ synthase [Polymorphobacter fuscus]|uniref:Glutamine-dependent NAD(+) synthetase n=1 Tax=Sandarakinorhabdus fusca TaxID=1439888 RepID=A0A7C9GPE9_9SPHN|nr:NAD+ synthase [Polymorphobacter fuscus]KAB7647405.1 NAD+ synthase [Polymorphobacter fuscus]MQT16650.1 NAD+ synthase [Polymorphobacter fuscus]NJC09365.1 NAD+ synthase [Polymorphobacter fuscus]
MTTTLALALAQLNASVGGLAANTDAILAARAKAPAADLVVTPELSVIGYPPEDLVLKPALVTAAMAHVEQLAAATADGGPALLVGAPLVEDGRLHNAMFLLDGGKIAGITRKHDLPNYGTFDEKRVFAAGPLPGPLAFRGLRLGVPICEDMWTPDVTECLAETGAEILIVPNGSPFETGKGDRRLSLAVARVTETDLPLVYLNRVGGQDELVFDGASFIVNADRTLPLQMPDWEEAVVISHWTRSTLGHHWTCAAGALATLDADPADIYHAMLVALRDYVNRNGFPGVVLGLSGGIDSALSAAVAVDALGADRVWCVMMPSPYTSRDSLEDAAECARLLGCRLDTLGIGPAMTAFDAMLAPLFAGRPADTAEENIQSRIRGLSLMALSNKFGPMLLTTGNKSEMSVGYATIYGDMAGGYSVLKDVYKTTVFKLCEWRNGHRPRLAMGPAGPVMPRRVIDKPPSAELRDNQTDQDSLPPYDLLDRILIGLVENERAAADLVAEGLDPAVVARIERLLSLAEYKRRQAPPGVKIGSRNFGRDRRYPITNAFRTA